MTCGVVGPVGIRPTCPKKRNKPCSVNQRLPSGPAAIPIGLSVGRENSVMTPAGVIRPILLSRNAVTQRLPSVPVVISQAPVWGGGMENSVMAPAVVIRPIWLAANSVNQRLPSGPAEIPHGTPSAVGMENSVMTPAVVILP